MFDAADLIALPTAGSIHGVPKRGTAEERFLRTGIVEVDGDGLNRNRFHVLDACAMADGSVALAMSNGELCHGNLSKAGATAIESVSAVNKEWPQWTSWPTRHGKVVCLQYDRAHDALVTIEQATTAAGDQAFLGRYHRDACAAGKEEGTDWDDRQNRNASARRTNTWIGCSVPLATNHAQVAICASRGWAAVATGYMVNLWAVARQDSEQPKARRDSSSRKQAPVGFEHALSVDLAELLGNKGGAAKTIGARHIALHGNLLAVATDHAVFLLRLSFDVKGEMSASDGSTPATNSDAPETQPSERDSPSPTAESPRTHPPRSNPRDKSVATMRSSFPATLKSEPKNAPQRLASRGSLSSNRRGSTAAVEGSECRSSASPGLRKEVGSQKGKTKPERRDGVIECSVSEADDLIVSVLDPGENGDSREADCSLLSPPLLRAFDDDWEAIRARRDFSAEPVEPEATPLATGVFPINLPVSGNSTVLDRACGCEVLLARRVGPGEVVKQLHLMPLSKRDSFHNSDGQHSSKKHESHHPVARSCSFVLLTSKGATACLVCALPSAPVVGPAFPALARPLSPGNVDRRWLLPSYPPSPPPEEQHSKSHLGGLSHRPRARLGPGLSAGIIEGVAAAADVAEDSQQMFVFLRRCCRFNSDLLLASINSVFLFVLTVEGVEVWTFPPDELGLAGERLENGSAGETGTLGSRLSPTPPPRPCLLHVQRFEVDGVLPRSPASCMVPLEGTAPGLLLFPSSPADECASLAFLAHQRRRRLRSDVAADVPGEASGIPALQKPSLATNPFAWPSNDAAARTEQESWQRKLAAWQNGFCGLDRGGATATTPVSPLALCLRLRSPTEAFRLLAAAEECYSRPLSATASAMFVSAAEGLHSAITAGAAAAWSAAVCADGGDSGNSASPGRMDTLAGSGGGVKASNQTDIESILGGLANCWRLQRVAARCASLLAQLLLETAVSISEGPMNNQAAIGLAYNRACSWLLASGKPVVESFALLQDVAARLSALPGRLESSSLVEPSLILLDDANGDDEKNSYSARAGASAYNLEVLLPRAMYELYLLPSLGVGGTPESGPPPVQTISERKGLSSPLDDAVSGLVGYLHEQDMRQLSQRPRLRDLGDEPQRSMPLSKAVVYAYRIQWATCPVALSQAIVALGEQEKALAESSSCNRSSSSGSSVTSLSGNKSLSSVAKRSRPPIKPLRGAEHPREGSALSPDDHSNSGDGSSLFPAPEWVAVAQAVLRGYSEQMEGGIASAASLGTRAAAQTAASVRTASTLILQLACERHPSLVVPVAPLSVGIGPLARDLLAEGRAQPVVAALVKLTSCSSWNGRSAGSSEASFGPHRARELLQLTGDCFASPVDPLQALCIFGVSGRQIAARLDSLRRASLDLPGAFGFPTDGRRSDDFPHDYNGDDFSVSSRQEDLSETISLSVAAREFLSRRCSASLATTDAAVGQQERLSQAIGAPEAWLSAFARNRALDRAILRYLISAHLDDLRALETSTAGIPKSACSTPAISSGWGGGLGRESARARNRRNRQAISWRDAIVPLLSGQVSRARGGPAEEHLDAILCLIREISWRAKTRRSGGTGCSMSHEEAEEVVMEATRRLPASGIAPVLAAGNFEDLDDSGQVNDDTHPWGSGGEGMGARRAPWPWGPRAVPASAVGAVLALAAALPPAGKLLAGLDVMLQAAAEVVAAAKSDAAVSAGAVAAASGAVGKGGARGGHSSPKDSKIDPGETHASVGEVSRAAERALLLYTSEFCGKDPDMWASVTEHVRNTSYDDGQGNEGNGPAFGGSVAAAGNKLVRALLRRCGEELGGKALVRALPGTLSLRECLDELERALLND